MVQLQETSNQDVYSQKKQNVADKTASRKKNRNKGLGSGRKNKGKQSSRNENGKGKTILIRGSSD